MGRVLVVGDVAIVVSGGIDRLPVSGENVVLHEGRSFVSGVGSNVALNLRRLGADVVLASGVGEDRFGDFALEELSAAGVDVRFVRRTGEPTGTMLLMVEPDGERTMVGTRGASERFELDAAQVLDATLPDHVHVSGYALIDSVMDERCDALVRAAEARAIPCTVDLEGVAASGRRTPLERVTALCNRDELARYFGTRDVAAAGRGRAAPLVVKAGRDGCDLAADGAVAHVAAQPDDAPVDTTGAGDAFDAAFVAARLAGLDLAGACGWGNAAGRLKVRTKGPRAPLSLDAVRAGSP